MPHRAMANRVGSIITLAMLLLYIFTTWFLFNDVIQWFPSLKLYEGTINIHTTIGGLVSALVVTRLAITPLGESLSHSMMTDDTPPRMQSILTFVTWAYLSIWIFIGLASLVFGVMFFQGINQTLHDSGTVWLGTAVAASYSYLGIRPIAPSSSDRIN